jgi:hypothetical protein
MTIEEIENHIQFLQKILILLKEESDSIEEIVFKKYLEFESLSKVKIYVQNKGSPIQVISATVRVAGDKG